MRAKAAARLYIRYKAFGQCIEAAPDIIFIIQYIGSGQLCNYHIINYFERRMLCQKLTTQEALYWQTLLPA